MGNTKSELKLYKMEEGSLQQLGSLPISAGAAACNVVELNKEKAYLSCQGINQIVVFNPSTMTKIKTIDVSKFSHEGTMASPSSMIIRDNYLYIPLSQFDAKWMPKENTVEILLYDVKTDEYVKTIKNSSLGVSVPTRPIDSNSIFMDENKDIYINCMASFGFKPGFPGGIIRIKNGETEIDPNYCIRLDKTKIKGLKTNYAEFFGSVYYDKQGKMYAYANSYSLVGNSVSNPYLAICNAAVCVDLKAQTIEVIDGLPLSNPHAIAIGKYKEKIISKIRMKYIVKYVPQLSGL